MWPPDEKEDGCLSSNGGRASHSPLVGFYLFLEVKSRMHPGQIIKNENSLQQIAIERN